MIILRLAHCLTSRAHQNDSYHSVNQAKYLVKRDHVYKYHSESDETPLIKNHKDNELPINPRKLEIYAGGPMT